MRHREQSLDTARHKRRRQDTDVRQQEQTVNTARRKGRRQNAEYRQQEQISDTARKRLQHDCHSVADLRCLSVPHVISSCTNTVFKKPALYVHYHCL